MENHLKQDNCAEPFDFGDIVRAFSGITGSVVKTMSQDGENVPRDLCHFAKPGLTEEQLELLKLLETLGGEYARIAQECEATFLERNASPMFRVTTAGHVNPGKSTLLNALIGKEEVFKTADARQTTLSQEEKYGDYLLVDTPGCDSDTQADDDEAYSSFRRADMILFVHNINTGGIIKAELGILKDLLEMFGKDDFTRRVKLICTRSDEILDEEDARRNVHESLNLIQDNLHCVVECFTVSPRYWLDGLGMLAESRKQGKSAAEQNSLKDDAAALMEQSHLEEVKKAIDACSNMFGKRKSFIIGQFCKKLIQRHNRKEKELQAMKFSLSQARGEVQHNWQQMLQQIYPAWTSCQDDEE